MKVDRQRLRSLKGIKWSKYGPDVIPAWVADMDFLPSPRILSEIQKIVDLGDFGYRYHDVDLLIPAWCEWVEESHGWLPPADECRVFTSSMNALEAVMLLHTEPGDGVVLFSPIYMPFRAAIEQAGRTVVDVQLQGPDWKFEANSFKDSLDSKTRVVLFCQPHNPTGHIYTKEEINDFAEIVAEHDLIVISDEIWADLAFEGNKHLSLFPNHDKLRNRTVTIGSASKAFNLAGARCCVAHVGSASTRSHLEKYPDHYFGLPSSFGSAASVAAWKHGKSWLQDAKEQIQHNRDYIYSRILEDPSGLTMHLPESTYLGWLDFSNTSLSHQPSKELLYKAQIALEPGDKFGEQCGSFARLNFATGIDIVEELLERMLTALNR